jgi:hypothetical protein
MTNASTTPAERWAPWIAGLLLASPVLVAFYPPMTDLPFHEAAIGLLRHRNDPAMVPPGLYVLNLGQPNQLFHMVGWALSYLVSTRWAVKLLVAAAVVAIPACAARFARHVGASPLAALVVAPIAIGWMFNWGLITNLIGLASLLAFLPALDRFADEPTARGAATVLGGIVFLYCAHEAMMFVYAGVALFLAALQPWSPAKKALARLSPLLFGAVVAAAQLQWQKHLLTPGVRAMPRLWHPVWHKLLRIPSIILPASDPAVELAMFAMCVLAIASFFWLRSRERGPWPAARGSGEPALAWWRRRVHRYRWEIFAAIGFAAYLAFPLSLNSATLVYQRWFPPAFAVFVVVGAPRVLWTRQGRVASALACLLPVATLLVAWPSFVDSSRAYQYVEQLLPYVEPGSAVAALDLGPGDASRTFSLSTFGGRVLATRGGRLSYSFTDSPISPVFIPKQYQWNDALIRTGFDCWSFRPEQDLKSFRYVIVRTSDANVAVLAELTLRPEAKPVFSVSEWVLFESTQPVIPPVSPPLRPGKPPPDELRDRADRLAKTLGGLPQIVVPSAHEPDLVAPNGQQL